MTTDRQKLREAEDVLALLDEAAERWPDDGIPECYHSFKPIVERLRDKVQRADATRWESFDFRPIFINKRTGWRQRAVVFRPDNKCDWPYITKISADLISRLTGGGEMLVEGIDFPLFVVDGSRITGRIEPCEKKEEERETK